jgi:hypothetical protein
MTIDYSMYGENTWEYAAWKAIREHDLDVPATRKEAFAELYESEQFAMVGAKAWNELSDWTISDQVGLMAQKQHDYGHANILKFGAQGIKVRLWDKIARYENLVTLAVDPTAANYNGTVDSITDTLIDIVGYTTILFMVQRGTFVNPLADAESADESQRPA